MFIDLSHRLVLVTGGSRGIGRGVVERLVGYGAHVALTYRSGQAEAEELARRLGGNGSRVWAFAHDISDAVDGQVLVEQIENECGEIFALVNNAGITQDGLFITSPLSCWDSVLGVNLSGTAYMTHAVLQKMIRRKAGKVVNMSSVSGLRASLGQANYSASKAGLIALTRTLSHEVARFGIQVNAVAPGFIDTEMVAAMPEAQRQQLPKQIPMRRLGRVEEVADAIAYLLSPQASYVTGHTLVIDGGLSV